MLHIRIADGPGRGSELKTYDTRVSIGRAPECRLVLKDDRMASRLHGELYLVGGRAMYRDLQSHNGSMIDTAQGESIQLTPLLSEWPVRRGDQIRIGRTTLEVVSTAEEEELPESMIGTLLQAAEEDERAGSHPRSGPALTGLSRFLKLLSYDPTDVRQAKQALAQALLHVFPQASCVAIVDIKQRPGRTATPQADLTREDIDREGLLVLRREDDPNPTGSFSFQLMRRAYRRGGLIWYGSPAALPDSDSVRYASMASCMCAPLFENARITGFVHLHTVAGEPCAFSSRDTHLFAMLASLASLLIRHARTAQEQAVVQTMASIGQILAGLTHDAKTVMGSMERWIALLERDTPELGQSKAWSHIKEGLELLGCLCRDVRSRISTRQETLVLVDTKVADSVAGVLLACLRFFVSEAEQQRVDLENACDPADRACADADALRMALMNCVKNSLDAYATGQDRGLDRECTVRVTSQAEAHYPDDYLVVSVIDNAGGIPEHIVQRLGEAFVSTKGDRGTGLGFNIILDTVARLRGFVRIATSTRASQSFPAGTVVSLVLPKHAEMDGGWPRSPMIVADYESYRRRFDARASQPAVCCPCRSE
jgi:signal transduction histidine kinase